MYRTSVRYEDCQGGDTMSEALPLHDVFIDERLPLRVGGTTSPGLIPGHH